MRGIKVISLFLYMYGVMLSEEDAKLSIVIFCFLFWLRREAFAHDSFTIPSHDYSLGLLSICRLSGLSVTFECFRRIKAINTESSSHKTRSLVASVSSLSPGRVRSKSSSKDFFEISFTGFTSIATKAPPRQPRQASVETVIFRSAC